MYNYYTKGIFTIYLSIWFCKYHEIVSYISNKTIIFNFTYLGVLQEQPVNVQILVQLIMQNKHY